MFGKVTEDFAQVLHKLKAPCIVVMTIRKTKTVLPSLKPPVNIGQRIGFVYKIQCLHCQACYIGQTARNITTRISEHKSKKSPLLVCRNSLVVSFCSSGNCILIPHYFCCVHRHTQKSRASVKHHVSIYQGWLNLLSVYT